MSDNRFFIFIIATFVFATTSCVSLPIGKDEAVKATNVNYTQPEKPFNVFEQNNLDAAWKNNNNGNSISYLSDCSNESDPNLKTIRQSITNGVANLKILEEKRIDYNNRKALRSVLTGDIDGVSTKFELVILKKNNCIYVLTYVGLTDYFAQDQKLFSRFVEGFKAP